MDNLGSLSLRYAYLRLERLIWTLLGKPGWRFSTPRIWSSTTNAAPEHRRTTSISWWRKRQKIITRKDCWYTCFDLAALPANKRTQALWLQIEQWSPISAPFQQWIIWEQGVAMVWVWETGKTPKGKGYAVPESLLYPRAYHRICHYRLSEGFELQYWDKQGVLRRSQWSGSAFSPFALQTFYLGIGNRTANTQDGDNRWLQAKDTPPADYPWSWPAIPVADKLMFSHYLMMGLAFFAVCGFASWLTADIVRITRTEKQWHTELVRLQQTLAPQIQTRKDALSERQQALSIAALLPQSSQLELLSRIVAVFQTQALHRARIKRWAFADGQVEVEVAGVRDIDRSALVAAMQKTGNFMNIRIDNVKKSDRLRILAMPALVDGTTIDAHSPPD